jgi:hypothetical protein
MKSEIENIMEEIIETEKWYKRTDNLDLKNHYESYINLLIENDAPKEYKSKLHNYWERLLK